MIKRMSSNDNASNVTYKTIRNVKSSLNKKPDMKNDPYGKAFLNALRKGKLLNESDNLTNNSNATYVSLPNKKAISKATRNLNTAFINENS